MSLKELKQGKEEGSIVFGIRQALKLSKGRKKPKVFVVGDVRDETLEKLRNAKIKFEDLGRLNKEQVSAELDLDFKSEVFTIK